MHVGGGGDDLGRAHLLHALQRLLSLGRVQVRMGTLAGHLQFFLYEIGLNFANDVESQHKIRAGNAKDSSRV